MRTFHHPSLLRGRHTGKAPPPGRLSWRHFWREEDQHQVVSVPAPPAHPPKDQWQAHHPSSFADVELFRNILFHVFVWLTGMVPAGPASSHGHRARPLVVFN